MRLTLWGSGCGTRRQIENTHRDLVGQDREGSAEYSGGAVDLALVADRWVHLKRAEGLTPPTPHRMEEA